MKLDVRGTLKRAKEKLAKTREDLAPVMEVLRLEARETGQHLLAEGRKMAEEGLKLAKEGREKAGEAINRYKHRRDEGRATEAVARTAGAVGAVDAKPDDDYFHPEPTGHISRYSLNNADKAPRAFITYDPVDGDLIHSRPWSWQASRRYVRGRRGRNNDIRLSREIAKRMLNVDHLPSGLGVHHRNGDKTDFRRCNMKLLWNGGEVKFVGPGGKDIVHHILDGPAENPHDDRVSQGLRDFLENEKSLRQRDPRDEEHAKPSNKDGKQ